MCVCGVRCARVLREDYNYDWERVRVRGAGLAGAGGYISLYDYDFLFNFTISYQSRGPWININSRTLVFLSHKARCPMQFIIYMKVLTEVEMWCGAWSCDMSYVMCVVRVRCVRTAASRFALAFGLQ